MRDSFKVAAIVGAIGAAAVLIVLPAERGVDITGFGRLIGLTEMGEIKVEIAEEMAAEAAYAEKIRIADSLDVADSAAVARADVYGSGARTDTMTITLPPLGQAEVRVSLRRGSRVSYSWSTQQAPIDFTVFGDSLTKNRAQHLYNAGKDRAGKTGVIAALFDGEHGWYWRSRAADTVILRLRTLGDYSAIREVPQEPIGGTGSQN